MNGKENCDVALDLMLLDQEGLSREGSRVFLQEHLERCEPCRKTYEALKQQPKTLQVEEEQAQEQQALAKSMKRAGRRMRLGKRIVAVCVLIVLVVLAVGGVQNWRWNRRAAMPLELYRVEMSSYDALIHLDVECFTTDYYGFEMKSVPVDENGLMAQGDPVIVTYKVHYYPYRAAQRTMISPASRWEAMDYRSMCIRDGQIYMIAESDIIKEDGRDAVLMTPGSLVAEIRVSDGRETRTIYTSGDKVQEKLKMYPDQPSVFRLAE